MALTQSAVRLAAVPALVDRLSELAELTTAELADPAFHTRTLMPALREARKFRDDQYLDLRHVAQLLAMRSEPGPLREAAAAVQAALDPAAALPVILAKMSVVGNQMTPRRLAGGMAGGLALAATLVGLWESDLVRGFVHPAPTPAPTAAPAAMGGDFNVAVAQVGKLGANGKVQATAAGDQVGQRIYEMLRDELDRTPSDFRDFKVELWYDGMPGAERHLLIGIVPGATPDERAASAADLARKLRADMIIGGVLVDERGLATFLPEFYILPTRQRHDADDLVGRHGLGRPVPDLDLDDPASKLRLNQALDVRARALVHVIFGLTYEFAGQPDRALGTLRAAEDALDDWEEDDGKELLYLLLGREAHMVTMDRRARADRARRAGRSDQADALDAQAGQALDAALGYYRQAVRINPSYARAYLGIGNYHYDRAERQPREARLERGDIHQAIDQFLIAAIQAERAGDRRTQTKAQLALGNAYLTLEQAQLGRGDRQAAGESLDFAVERLNQVLALADADNHRHRGHANLGLGGAYAQQAYLKQAAGDEAGRSALHCAAAHAYSACVSETDMDRTDLYLSTYVRPSCAAALADVILLCDENQRGTP